MCVVTITNGIRTAFANLFQESNEKEMKQRFLHTNPSFLSIHLAHYPDAAVDFTVNHFYTSLQAKQN